MYLWSMFCSKSKVIKFFSNFTLITPFYCCLKKITFSCRIYWTVRAFSYGSIVWYCSLLTRPYITFFPSHLISWLLLGFCYELRHNSFLQPPVDKPSSYFFENRFLLKVEASSCFAVFWYTQLAEEAALKYFRNSGYAHSCGWGQVVIETWKYVFLLDITKMQWFLSRQIFSILARLF